VLKIRQAGGWYSRPIKCMRKAVLSISGIVYKQQEMEIGKLIYDV
jgi:hypothetical protein